MAEVPVPTNPTVNIVDQIIQGLIYNAGVSFIIAWATANLPFLGLPIIKQLFAWGIGKLGQALSTEMQNQVAFTIIGFKSDLERSQYEDSVAALMVATQGGKPGDIDKATAQFRVALGNLIHWDGS